jgi:ABC-2 type transport system permease protein
LNAVLTIAFKDLRLLARDRAGFFWVLGFPFLMALFFGSIISGGAHKAAPMKIAVVDLDGSGTSRTFTARLRESEALNVIEAPLDSAAALVRLGRLVGYVALRPGMGRSFGFGSRDSAKIEIGLDPSRRAEAGYLRGLVTQALFQSIQSEFTTNGAGQTRVREEIARVRADSTIAGEHKARVTSLLENLNRFMTSLDSVNGSTAESGSVRGVSPSAGLGPNIRTVDVAERESGPRSAFEVTFPSGIMWALIGICMSFAVSIVEERLSGTFLRLRLAPISRTQVLAGKGVAAFLAAMGATGLLIAFGAVVLHVRVINVAALVAALGASAFCFVGLMMLISAFGRSRAAVAGAGWAILLVMSMTGGGMIPLIAMPEWMLTVSNFSLVKWGVLAIEGAIWRGFSWGEMAFPLLILVAVGALAFWIGARALTRSDT